MKVMKFSTDKFFSVLLNPVTAVLIAFAIGGLVISVTGGDPIKAYDALITGSFGSWSAITRTVRFTLPIMMLGVSFGICARSGYFNIGQEGQMYAAAISVAATQYFFGYLNNTLLIIMMVFIAILFSGLLSYIPAFLKIRLGTDEVIVSMLLNYIMVLLSNFLLLYSPFAEKGKSTALSIEIKPVLGGFFIFIMALVSILLYSFVVDRTYWGYRLRLIGKNPIFAKLSGINISKYVLVVAFIGGAFSGLSISGEIFGAYHRVYNGFAANLGFYGMTAALIGGDSVLVLVLGALLLGSLQSGSISLSVMTDVPSELVLVVQGFVMLFATIKIFRHFQTKKIESRRVSQ